MKAAFRNLGISRKHWKYLIMKAKSPIDGLIYYFADKCLPFGASISCSHFQRFSNAIAFLMSHRTGQKPINYLNDYLFAALMKVLCDSQVNMFIELCKEINFPVNLDKTYWGTTVLVFLGLLIDTEKQTVSIPINKIETARSLIQSVLLSRNKKVTVAQLRKICGFLNFLSRCVIPSRTFT